MEEVFSPDVVSKFRNEYALIRVPNFSVLCFILKNFQYYNQGQDVDFFEPCFCITDLYAKEGEIDDKHMLIPSQFEGVIVKMQDFVDKYNREHISPELTFDKDFANFLNEDIKVHIFFLILDNAFFKISTRLYLMDQKLSKLARNQYFENRFDMDDWNCHVPYLSFDLMGFHFV